jgi:hypothetical protein
MRSKSGKTSGLRKLTCHLCQAQGRVRDTDERASTSEDTYSLTVERGQTKRSYHQRRRTAVNVTCSRGHEFWSVHPEAVAQSRKEDEAATDAPA